MCCDGLTNLIAPVVKTFFANLDCYQKLLKGSRYPPPQAIISIGKHHKALEDLTEADIGGAYGMETAFLRSKKKFLPTYLIGNRLTDPDINTLGEALNET